MAFFPLAVYFAIVAYCSGGIEALKALGVGLLIGLVYMFWFTFFIKKSMTKVEKS
jgi:hypothetical protein